MLSAWAPPLITFNIGTGILNVVSVLLVMSSRIYLYKGLLYVIAAAWAQAKETAKIALAPNLVLDSVPSNLIIISSNLVCSSTFWPINAGAIIVLTLLTAFNTPLPL